MKKILLNIFCLVSLCFIIPILFTHPFEIKHTNTNAIDIENIKNNEIYDYGEYSQIRLLHTKTNEVENVNLDEYLYNVVSAEMPASFENEALKAQAIVARTYTLYQIKNNQGKHQEADICDDSTCCQAWISKEERMAKWEENKAEEYWNKIINNVNETKGKVITYDNELINAFFHSNSGGTTEIPINVWGGTGYPYLQAVSTSRRRWIFSI